MHVKIDTYGEYDIYADSHNKDLDLDFWKFKVCGYDFITFDSLTGGKVNINQYSVLDYVKWPHVFAIKRNSKYKRTGNIYEDIACQLLFEQATVINHRTPIGIGEQVRYKCLLESFNTDLYSVVDLLAGPFKGRTALSSRIDHSDFDVIIISSTPRLIEKCLTAICETSIFGMKVHVVGFNNDEVVEIANRYGFNGICYTADKFNFSEINNYVVDNYCTAEKLFLMNDDVFVERNSLKEMLGVMELTNAEIVGSCLFYPGLEKVQHFGIHMQGGRFLHNISGTAIMARDSFYTCRVNAVTFALVCMSRSVYKVVRLDEQYYGDANDVDFCLRAREMGYDIWCSVEGWATHAESETRKNDNSMKGDVGSKNLVRVHQKLIKRHFIYD